MILSPALKSRLANAVNELAQNVEHTERKKADLNMLLGVGAVVLGAPVMALRGMFPALSLIGFGLYKLNEARKHEEAAELVKKMRNAYLPRPSLTPRLRP